MNWWFLQLIFATASSGAAKILVAMTIENVKISLFIENDPIPVFIPLAC
jgi:hypothetical protein